MLRKKITQTPSLTSSTIAQPPTNISARPFNQKFNAIVLNWGVYLSTPIICTIDCLTTYTATASVNIMQSRNTPFSNALKIQLKQPNGFLHGVIPFWVGKNKSRLSGLALGPRLMGDNPTLITTNLVAMLTGLTETVITNPDIVKSRLKVINNSVHVEPAKLKHAARAVFPIHLIKNTATFMVAFNSNKFTPQWIVNHSPCNLNVTQGLFTGTCIMLLQLCGASHLDTIMTLIAQNSYNGKNADRTLTNYYKYITAHSKHNNTSISLARAAIFGVSYSCTFILMAEIKDLIRRYQEKININDSEDQMRP